MERLRAQTPARIATGRTGTRYLTTSALSLREDHCAALDAVTSRLPEGWAEAQGYIALASQARDPESFLLQPALGRRLDEVSRERCRREADHGVDVQLIAGDGLSAVALERHGVAVMTALERALRAAGFRVGRPLFVALARVAVQDDIGVLTAARATVITLGERPGLGGGDSLSLYAAYGPKLGQDNAEKDCVSNVRPLGFSAEEAARRCTALLLRAFAAGGGGVLRRDAGNVGAP